MNSTSNLSSRLYELDRKFAEYIYQHPVKTISLTIFDLLLQVFSAGRLTNGLGQTVQCRDTIFVMTSNVGADLMLSTNERTPIGLETEVNTLLT